ILLVMKTKIIFFCLIFCSFCTNVQSETGKYENRPKSFLQDSRKPATITFTNKSDYTMTLKVMHIYGGLYSTIELPPKTSRKMNFTITSTYDLKIKATHNGFTSYHKGGNFSVTCTDREWTEGEMSFSLSTHGNGLGPKISAKEFESNN
ncbi:MAG: hypothetical protein ACRCZQ_09465, partial [Bacteroidales bacterium]